MLVYNLWWKSVEENEDKDTWESPLIPTLHWVNLAVLIMQIAGVLGNPYVTLAYAME